MSASDNVTRLARRIQKLTGLQYCRSRELAEQVRVFVKHPVPDAETAAQVHLEAVVVYAFATALSSRNVTFAVFGVVASSIAEDGLTLRLDPSVGTDLVTRLLLYRDVGEFAVRASPVHGGITMCGRSGPERITFVNDDGTPLVFDPERLLPSETARVHDYPGGPGPHELLLSRILRRPALLNQTAALHGTVRCHARSTAALVIEWCCGDTFEALFATLLAHGVADGLPSGRPAEFFGAEGVAFLGDRMLELKRHVHSVFSCDWYAAPRPRAEVLR
ncbi:hypothetical protein PUR71_40325 [Streptomyces sp. SP17BM10]|uniref:hypothetical protein n=1 Tax=Streptomyces sp. SP17BM10 TaxID=3002530 RepID=UPI002E78722C|nr:hypothetical protein [Streptomyces sp. SP17BM10]MEE1789107.1 hypothetical protein [Streptomyces sp. SP17BM10]